MSKQILHIKNGTTQGYIDLTLPGCADLAYPNSKNRRGRVQSDGRVCPTITAATTGIHYFKITEREEDNSMSEQISLFSTVKEEVDDSAVVDEETIETEEVDTAEKIDTSNDDFRIRKLTPNECWRLMAFKDEDYNRAEAVSSKTSLYKQAGNSIVVNCLMAIFSQLNIKGVKPWNECTDEELTELSNRTFNILDNPEIPYPIPEEVLKLYE